MDHYGMTMAGAIVVEKLPIRPDWAVSDTGRIIFDISTGNYWLGAHSVDIGSTGWVSLGLTINSVSSFNINWDTNLTGTFGAVSAKDIPVLYNEEPQNIQYVVDDIFDQLNDLSNASQLQPAVIKDYHLDFTGSNRISAIDIPIDNTEGYFGGVNVKIEDALNQLAVKTAADVPLNSTLGQFGSNLGFTSTNVQGALEDLESYLFEIKASQIPCTYEGCGCDTNVQFVIDALYYLHSNIRLSDLIDVPTYDVNNRFLKSNGVDKVDWVSLYSNDIIAQYPGTTLSNVQAALWNIGINLDNINNRLNSLKFLAEDIEYTLGGQAFLNVDDALDFIFSNFYNATNRPTATEISCAGIGMPSNNNVQLSLSYLNNQINTILSQMPCSVGAEDVGYYSAQGSTDIAHTLDYIMGFISYLISTNTSITYPPFAV